MAVDTPARIAILGAGPVGLETAIYARFLGYEVDLFERGRVCEHLQRWGHVRLFTPAVRNRTSLGLAALRAQDEALALPADDALVTAREMVESYFLPLANSDLLVDSLRLGQEVLAVGREELLKGDLVGDEERGDYGFRILTRDSAGQEQMHLADVVIDTTGTYGSPSWLGEGGIPALGERDARRHIEYGLPDLLGSARADYAGRHVLLVGESYAAAVNVVALAKLAEQVPGTRVTWITHRAAEGQPIIAVSDPDPFPERSRIARTANELARTGGAIAHLPATTVHAAGRVGEGFEVELNGEHAGPLQVDRILANVGYQPDNGLYRELQVQECYASDAPLKLATALREGHSDRPGIGPESLLNPEPNFYLLGAKSHGRDGGFLIPDGHAQIRDLFTILGDRAELDLYKSVLTQ